LRFGNKGYVGNYTLKGNNGEEHLYGVTEKFSSRHSSCHITNLDIQHRRVHQSWRRLAWKVFVDTYAGNGITVRIISFDYYSKLDGSVILKKNRNSA
jgi:hypothetical protein